jgi:thiol-disulfide isomerase/thioredoxin
MRRRIHQPLRVRLLGGLSALALLGVGCDGDKKPEPRATGQRSQAVSAAAGPAPSAAVPPPVASARAKKPPRKLCVGELDKPGRALPEKSLARAAAPGAREVPAKLAPRAGAWTWVNFWAAWCVPCKEEMPRLLEFEKKLAGKLALVFVTLDDDKRQLDDFLKAQSERGVRATYWLEEGKQRTEWLEAAGIEEDPELPTHLLLDPEGKIRCRVKGAVEDSDFESLAAIVAR